MKHVSCHFIDLSSTRVITEGSCFAIVNDGPHGEPHLKMGFISWMPGGRPCWETPAKMENFLSPVNRLQAPSLKQDPKSFMENNFLANLFARELQTEYSATKKCLEKIPANIYSFKPHPKSMELGYLALLVAEIPLWITHIVKEGVIDFATYKRYQLTTGEALLQHYEDSFKGAVEVLQQATDDQLEDTFRLQTSGQLLSSSSKKESIGSSINHWVHHRGQLTVYMRLNDIPVPSIYGPSADEKTF